MKKIVALLFISIYLFSTTEIHQFLKIPALFEHYNEHQSKDKALSFLSFLYKHYKENTKDADYDKDLKLPFKTINNCAPSIHISIVEESKIEAVKAVFSFDEKKINTFYTSLFISNFHNAIWQPPQLG